VVVVAVPTGHAIGVEVEPPVVVAPGELPPLVRTTVVAAVALPPVVDAPVVIDGLPPVAPRPCEPPLGNDCDATVPPLGLGEVVGVEFVEFAPLQAAEIIATESPNGTILIASSLSAAAVVFVDRSRVARSRLSRSRI
jgi:hypothetical protein